MRMGVRHIGQPRSYRCDSVNWRKCHRSENARTALEPHLHVFEAKRLHSNQMWLKRRQRTRRFELWQKSCRCLWPRHLRCRMDLCGVNTEVHGYRHGRQSHQCCRLVSVHWDGPPEWLIRPWPDLWSGSFSLSSVAYAHSRRVQ